YKRSEIGFPYFIQKPYLSLGQIQVNKPMKKNQATDSHLEKQLHNLYERSEIGFPYFIQKPYLRFWQIQ
ncbi:hypothetical protein BpHYR1_031761, partial [Brachionus plicatilis]